MRAGTLVSLALIGCNAVSGLSDFAIYEGAGGGAVQSASSSATTGGSAGTAGEGGAPNCPSDDFQDGTIRADKWAVEPATGAYFTETGGVLVLDVISTFGTPRYTRLLFTQSVSVADCAMKLQVLESTIGNEASEQFYFSAILDAQNSVGFILQDSFLSAGKMEGGILTVKSVTYNLRTHAWWRFRAQDSVVHFETSPDGSNWTEFNQETVGFSLTTLTLAIAGGAPLESTAIGGRTVMDNFNIP